MMQGCAWEVLDVESCRRGSNEGRMGGFEPRNEGQGSDILERPVTTWEEGANERRLSTGRRDARTTKAMQQKVHGDDELPGLHPLLCWQKDGTMHSTERNRRSPSMENSLTQKCRE